jgi:GDPmannose 4,6-dehydratase
MKKALITGITGQDGSYLAEILLSKGYEVHGIIRRASSFNTGRIDHLFQDPHDSDLRLFLHYGDLSDASNISRLIEKIQPDEIYHLGAQSHVRVSFDMPEYTADVTGMGTIRLLDAIKETGVKTKFYQASSSEMFGQVQEVPQRETTPFHPRSPYGCAKVFSYWITKNYRESYGLFAVNGILFNHESPRRGETFVTRKITKGLSRIKLGMQDKIYIGNLEARRDWGYAKDYVEGMWQMLQQDRPDDFVLATGETHSIREFIEETCRLLDIDLVWRYEGLAEQGLDRRTNQVIIAIDKKYFRPAEVDLLIGDYSKAKTILGWEPSIKFKELVKLMTEADYKTASQGLSLPQELILSSKEETLEFMPKTAKIFVAGHKGLVGSALVRKLKDKGYNNLVLRTRAELDLLDQTAVKNFFEIEKPEFVFLAAAKVGGIMANKEHKADFIYENLLVQNNIIYNAYKSGVKKLLFLGSSCIYPKLAPQPLKEEYLMSDKLEETNDAYALAKIAGIKMCQSFNEQYGTNFISVMPTNLYGPNDRFDLQAGHVLPVLIRRFYEAKTNNQTSIVLWGTGQVYREFLHVDDLADACLWLMNNYHDSSIINIGTGVDLTIKELAETIKNLIGYQGTIVWDSSKPDGTPRKLLDVSKLNNLGWHHKIDLSRGLTETINWFIQNQAKL